MEYNFADKTRSDYASHLGLDFNQDVVTSIEERLRRESNKLTLPLQTEIGLLEELTSFELGRFLLQNKGLNGYWTHYIILGDHNVKEGSLEYWVLNYAPAVLATRERFSIFKQKTNEILKSNMVLASIPCGLMDDLLSLDYLNKENIKLVGIDLDPLSLNLARQNSVKYNKNLHIEFKLEDAWNLTELEEYGLITSNGLNIYESSEVKIIKLYQKFYDSLRKDGYLITSFLTPPPVLSPDSTWKNFSMDDVTKQKAIFGDILQVKWQAFFTEEQVRTQLEQVGFQVLDIIYDKQAMFPTIIAKK